MTAFALISVMFPMVTLRHVFANESECVAARKFVVQEIRPKEEVRCISVELLKYEKGNWWINDYI